MPEAAHESFHHLALPSQIRNISGETRCLLYKYSFEKILVSLATRLLPKYSPCRVPSTAVPQSLASQASLGLSFSVCAPS